MEHSEEQGESKVEYFSTTEYSGGDMYGYNAPALAPKPEIDKKRPIIISIFCIIGFIGVLIAPILALMDSAKKVGDWYPPYLLLAAAVYLCTYIGLWLMKGWAPILLLIMFLVNQGVLYGMGLWTPISLGNAIAVIIALSYLKKMD